MITYSWDCELTSWIELNAQGFSTFNLQISPFSETYNSYESLKIQSERCPIPLKKKLCHWYIWKPVNPPNFKHILAPL